MRQAVEMDFGFLVFAAIGLSLAMTGAWAIQRQTGNSGWIDTIWSFAVGVGGMASSIWADGAFERRILAFVIIALWALRLGSHIGSRSTGAKEDPRYAKLVEEWGAAASSKLFWFLQIQAVAALVLVTAAYLAASNQTTFPRAMDVIALFLAIIALAGEALSDQQLARFRKTPEAKTGVCESGLWRYSRHPNYFFEWLFWCVWPLLAMTTSGWSWLSLLAPVMMYWLLVHVSGIPPLEDHMLRSRGEKFKSLQARVNAFFPGPRKSTSVRQQGATE
jgi:steroid 5-alpha reductase family enzyme